MVFFQAKDLVEHCTVLVPPTARNTGGTSIYFLLYLEPLVSKELYADEAVEFIMGLP